MTHPDPLTRLQPETRSTAILAHAERAIGEICAFRASDLFGHLFEFRPAFLSGIRTVEADCATVLEASLRADLTDATPDPLIRERATSRLEESLGRLLGAQSPFWEQYYARLLRASTDAFPGGGRPDWTAALVQRAARIRYPHFYTPIDAMCHGSGPQGLRDTLLPLSVQHFLEGSLLSITDTLLAGQAFQHANRLLGPVAAPAYRQLLARKMEECR